MKASTRRDEKRRLQSTKKSAVWLTVDVERWPDCTFLGWCRPLHFSTGRRQRHFSWSKCAANMDQCTFLGWRWLSTLSTSKFQRFLSRPSTKFNLTISVIGQSFKVLIFQYHLQKRVFVDCYRTEFAKHTKKLETSW